MKNFSISFLFLLSPLFLSAQDSVYHLPKHYFSINPLNMIFFQQIGLTYEFKPGMMGFGITGGYIYPNKKTYSNYFMAGPTNYGSLGDYNGFFVIPQVNFYLIKPRNPDQGSMIYIAPKFVYRYMHIDSTNATAWHNEGDGYYWYRKMIDDVNIYGAFIDFGYRYILSHFFFDLNFGIGVMWVNHNMTISCEETGEEFHPPHEYYKPLKPEELHQIHPSINFTLTLGGAF